MVNHIQGTGFTTDLETLKWQADINGDGLVNSFDVESSLEFVFKRESIKSLPFAGTLNTFPYDGEGDISLTREFVIHFNMPSLYCLSFFGFGRLTFERNCLLLIALIIFRLICNIKSIISSFYVFEVKFT